MHKKEVKVFVCGSMCKGMVHYNKIEPYVVSKTEAVAQGKVYRLPVGYHVFIESQYCGDKPDSVKGQLLTLEAPEILLTLIDEFHGVSPLTPEKGLHFKTEIDVMNENGQSVAAMVYSFNPKKITKKVLPLNSGNWQTDFEENPPLTTQLTDRQVHYIEKLGKSKGREIVPIDLQLYRELMNLDLIVDKGRRLALSKLGKDVFHYLA